MISGDDAKSYEVGAEEGKPDVFRMKDNKI